MECNHLSRKGGNTSIYVFVYILFFLKRQLFQVKNSSGSREVEGGKVKGREIVDYLNIPCFLDLPLEV